MSRSLFLEVCDKYHFYWLIYHWFDIIKMVTFLHTGDLYMSIEFRTQMANLFRARFPFVYIPTWEEERVITELRHLSTDQEFIKTRRDFLTWSQTEGFKGEGIPKHSDTKSPIKALEFIQKYEQPALFILKDFHVFLGTEGRPADPIVVRKLRDLVSMLESSMNPKNVVFVAPTLVIPNDLQKDITIMDFGFPSFEELNEVLDKILLANQNNSRIVIDLSKDEKELIVRAAQGLTIQEAENAFALALVSRGRLDIESVDQILKEKQQTIKKTGILEFIKSEPNMQDVGGLENLKRWLKKRNKSWLDSAREYSLPAPKGVLITGVPGCGKSLTAKAVSSMWHLPLLKLDMGKIFSGIVGSSEENMRKAIANAEALAPCILWIDEIEKGLSGAGREGDGGTSTRIFGTLLTWMQEKTKPVFVIATANNIQSLPPELLRKGRFDEIFFVDLPTKKERMDIFRIHLQKRLTNPKVQGDFSYDSSTLEYLAEITETFIGAEIEEVVNAALFEAFSEDRSIQLQDLEKVIRNVVPLSVTQSEQILKIREWANVRAVAATPREDRFEYSSSPKPEKVDSPSTQEDDIRFTRGGRTLDF
jgi:SpoVK/Ycf46/Vps4 family AAA+-type ATPase